MFAGDLHAKRIVSLAGATLGAIETCSLAVALIGQGLALARGLVTKQAVKQVDRMLANQGIDVDALLRHWVPYVVGKRPGITVAMVPGLDPGIEADGQATIMLSLLCRHGRATPLVWLTVDTATLKDRRNGYEYRALVRLAEVLPADVRVLIVADRGFGDHKLYRVLTEELKFDFVIRFRGNITVTAANGEARTAAERGGVYAKRWAIECAFRDSKDIRFGMGMSSVHVSSPDRRDRLWLINAFSVALLTLLGAAGEALGYDRFPKSNTTKRRTHSLLRQGHMLYQLIPTMPEHRLRPLIERFAEMLAAQPVFVEMFGAI